MNFKEKILNGMKRIREERDKFQKSAREITDLQPNFDALNNWNPLEHKKKKD